MTFITNPKLKDSVLIDCIPQTGQCPNNCAECYYNAPGFYTNKTKPIIPFLRDTKKKLVRVNSGHDSNINRELVLKTTTKYKHKFFNTSIPEFKNLAPVVFTCNGRDTDSTFLKMDPVQPRKNIMMIRFRANAWNTDCMKEAINLYSNDYSIPFTLTFMRYRSIDAIPNKYRNLYVFHKHILNPYWILKTEQQARILDIGQQKNNELVEMCGTFTSAFCKDCYRCVNCYKQWLHKNHPKEILPWEKL
jgi:hypothetical protein